ncbi:uncharacterized protein LOC129720380 [Wyeomyia smithii]|uniref:uncharacterized protein LOC129720380 n=1 Tax=Wyeomyia smithii TaxID=174621 RepID=UPI002467C97E|nr:uncharacterized protein LOC129720380 [Wyeomyia smithii]
MTPWLARPIRDIDHFLLDQTTVMLPKISLVVLVTVCILCVQTQKSKVSTAGKPTKFKIRFTKAVCINLPYEVAWNVSCGLKLVRNQPSQMYFSVTVDQIDQLFLTFAMYYKYQVTYQPLLMDTTFDVCSFLRRYNNRKHGGAIGVDQTAMFVIGIIEKNHPELTRNGCPYRGVIELKNFVIDESMAPTFIPAGDYRLDMHYYNEKNKTVMYSQVYGSVRAIGIADLSMG